MPWKLAHVMSQLRMQGHLYPYRRAGQARGGVGQSRLTRENARLPCIQLVVSKHAQHLPPLPLFLRMTHDTITITNALSTRFAVLSNP
jgi:hypothetical protein